jgi:5-methylcytosine-specific restriction endonuclease McrA
MRYHSDPLWREQQRLRARDKKLRTQIGREAASDGSLTPKAMVALFAAAKCCPFCRKRMKSQDKSLDHIVPLSKGGAHSILNALVCCKRCNAKKHARPIALMLSDGQQLPLVAA